jgi:hypothetical protein
MASLSYDSLLPIEPLASSVRHVCTVKGRTYTVDTPFHLSRGFCAGKPKPRVVLMLVLGEILVVVTGGVVLLSKGMVGLMRRVGMLEVVISPPPVVASSSTTSRGPPLDVTSV